jgi:S-DNA-T family DNA segregation ATPase FtsK/SpoIIIE
MTTLPLPLVPADGVLVPKGVLVRVPRAVAPPVPRRRSRLREIVSGAVERRQERSDAEFVAWFDARQAVDLKVRWRSTVEACNFGRASHNSITGVTRVGMPHVVHAEAPRFDRDGYLIITLPSGLLVSDLEEEREALASGLGVHSVSFVRSGADHVRVDLRRADPLERTVSFPLPAPAGHLAFGLNEAGVVVSRPLDALTHMIMQGSNGSGKSTGAYGLLGQLAGSPYVDVCGIDPTSLLLAPWGDHPRGWRVCGTEDAAARYGAVLADLVADMDARIRTLPPRCDKLPITPETPLRLIVLEEAGAIARLSGYSTSKPSAVQRLLSRLHGEARKASCRVWTLVQRAESGSISTFDRDQAVTRISYAANDVATLRMLHDVGPEHVTELTASPAGTAFMEAPGLPLCRIRSPFLDYATYCDVVSGSIPRPVAA